MIDEGQYTSFYVILKPGCITRAMCPESFWLKHLKLIATFCPRCWIVISHSEDASGIVNVGANLHLQEAERGMATIGHTTLEAAKNSVHATRRNHVFCF